MGIQMCMECSRGIFYPACLSLFRSSHPVDPVGAKKPPWLVTATQQPDPEKVGGIVADCEVERLRNATIARSVVEDHRSVKSRILQIDGMTLRSSTPSTRGT